MAVYIPVRHLGKAFIESQANSKGTLARLTRSYMRVFSATLSVCHHIKLKFYFIRLANGEWITLGPT
ncbi:hypothetical protein NDJ12_13580 [Vibrio alginolyticus]|uniref:hypothetical protein n=1 Tax=Vibrio alginolyticus TaxID=663 RepID=UPI00215EB69E|nr:hypothetical protein [Vibrio alginolyticus]MCS0214918.1 hypothetical protein [Vibrio alginolyticus]